MSKSISKEWIFLNAFLISFISHCSFFFGGAMAINEDNFTFYRCVDDIFVNAPYGRWFGDVLLKLGIVGSYRVPSWAGIFIILAMAIMCMAVLSIVKVRNKISAYLVIATLVTFPTLAYSYGYLFDSVLYAFSLMFAALAVWMTNKWKHGWLGGVFA